MSPLSIKRCVSAWELHHLPPPSPSLPSPFFFNGVSWLDARLSPSSLVRISLEFPPSIHFTADSCNLLQSLYRKLLHQLIFTVLAAELLFTRCTYINYTALHYTASNWDITLHQTALHYTILNYATLYYTILHCTVLHHTN